MPDYYSSTIILSWLSLGVLCLLVYENARIQVKDKQMLYLTYILIALSALAEYCGVMLSGRAGVSGKAVLFAKTADYILTPMAGGAIVFQMRLRNSLNGFMIGMLAVNTIVQLISCVTGWMVVVDEQNIYHHGPLYPLYFGLCLVTVGAVLMQFFLYGRRFSTQNRKSLYAIMILVMAGVLMQEVSGGVSRITYMALTMGAALLFIHYVEFGSLQMDASLKKQQIELDTDALTGVYSRYAYSLYLNELDKRGTLPEGFASFTVDINGLKQVNDKLGHEAGDELICGAAACINKALCGNGRCYRTGGDEFVVLTAMSREEAEAAVAVLQREADRWHGEAVEKLSLAAGFALASEHAGLSAEKLVGESDKAMYAAKSAYYRQSGMDRRQRR